MIRELLYKVLGIVFLTSLVIILLHFITGQEGWKIAIGIAALSFTGMLIAWVSSELGP